MTPFLFLKQNRYSSQLTDFLSVKKIFESLAESLKMVTILF